MTSIPVKRWTIESQKDDLSGLEYGDGALESNLGPDDVLVEMRTGSINYRDLVIAKGKLSQVSKPGVIPGSDGAGIVVQAGANAAFAPGDRVVTFLCPEKFSDPSLAEVDDTTLPRMPHISASLGQGVNGTMTTRGVFPQSCLAKIGDAISFEEAATLSCSGITAWNALMGLRGREIKEGDWLLIQGTGGVSVAAMQFALAVGATVVATTSSERKAEKLRALGAHHVINYKETPNWGSAARDLTPSKRGFDMIVDVGGQSTMGESLAAIRTDGVIVSAGLLGSSEESPDIMNVLGSVCIVRGVLLGTRQMMRDMVTFIEGKGIKMAFDDEKVFALREYQDALKRLEENKHFAKVLIKISEN